MSNFEQSRNNPPPNWFTTEIATGLRSLLALGLDGQPASELLGIAVSTWAADMWESRTWDEADVDRIRAGFANVRRQCKRWPTMYDFAGKVQPKHPAASYHAPFPKVEWDKHSPGNRSPTAKAHCKYGAQRLGIPVPAWAADADEDLMAQVHREVELHIDRKRREYTDA